MRVSDEEHAPVGVPASGSPSARGGLVVVGIVALVALGVRVAYAFGEPPPLFYGNDNTWYVGVARSFAEGHGGRLVGLAGTRVWSFRFPPGYPAALATGQRLLPWVRAADAYRWVSIMGGVAAAAMITRLGWRWSAPAPVRCRHAVAGIAGLIFALDPITAGASAALMSESLFMPVVAGVLLAVDHLLAEPPTARWVVALAALLAVGSLTRVEGLLYLGAPIVAGALVAGRPSGHFARWGWVAAVGILVVAGWSAFASTEAGRGVAVATNGSPFLGANCRASEYGDGAGYWSTKCLAVPPGRLSLDARAALATPVANPFVLAPAVGPKVEAELSRAQLEAGIDHITSDPLATVHAVPFRLARASGIYWTRSQADHETFEGRDRRWEAVGRWFHLLVVLPLALLALAGLVTRKRGVGRRLRTITDPGRLVPALAVLAVWIVGIVLTYGSARLRAPVEPTLALLAGLGAAVLVAPKMPSASVGAT